MAPPVTTSAGAGWAEIDGVVFRCHGWVEGVTKENEEATALEACAMGRIVAQLHSLAIPVHDVEPPPPVHHERLVELVQAGQGAPWASRLAEVFDQVVTIAGQAGPVDLG